ncbi:MAG: hypothetical protein ABI321_12130 [Polyangia bacterium]
MRTRITTALFSLVGPCILGLSGLALADPPAADPAPVSAKAMSKTFVCTDGKSRYIAVVPDPRSMYQLYYGDGKSMTIVTQDPSNMIGGLDFLDPRFQNPTANPDFRGIDWRNASQVEFDKDANTCSLRCGDRKQQLTLMPRAEGQQLFSAAKLLANPRTREPYALARDDRGIYYYVDRGVAKELRQSYRVWVGKKGDLKLQKMKDIAADSAGEVFSTASGDLRFITGTSEYTWVKGAQHSKLTKLPIEQNLNLIYNTLGIYAGQRLGTPCDDF